MGLSSCWRRTGRGSRASAASTRYRLSATAAGPAGEAGAFAERPLERHAWNPAGGATAAAPAAAGRLLILLGDILLQDVAPRTAGAAAAAAHPTSSSSSAAPPPSSSAAGTSSAAAEASTKVPSACLRASSQRRGSFMAQRFTRPAGFPLPATGFSRHATCLVPTPNHTRFSALHTLPSPGSLRSNSSAFHFLPFSASWSSVPRSSSPSVSCVSRLSGTAFGTVSHCTSFPSSPFSSSALLPAAAAAAVAIVAATASDLLLLDLAYCEGANSTAANSFLSESESLLSESGSSVLEKGAPEHIVNWSGTHEVATQVLYRPETIEELEAIVRAANAAKQPIRPVGSAISPNGIALSEHGMLSLALLDRVVNVDTATGRVRVQAGARVEQVTDALRPYGLTLQNYASVREQQIGGFIQVGAHGTGARIPPVDEQAVAIKLVTPNRGTLELSAEGDGDDGAELFYLARCGLGALGVVAEVTLQAVPSYHLLEETFVADMATIRKHHRDWLQQYQHIRYMWIPYTDTIVVVRSNPLRSPDSPTLPPSPPSSSPSLPPSTSPTSSSASSQKQPPTALAHQVRPLVTILRYLKASPSLFPPFAAACEGSSSSSSSSGSNRCLPRVIPEEERLQGPRQLYRKWHDMHLSSSGEGSAGEGSAPLKPEDSAGPEQGLSSEVSTTRGESTTSGTGSLPEASLEPAELAGGVWSGGGGGAAVEFSAFEGRVVPRRLSEEELCGLSFTQLRDELLALDPLNAEHVAQVNEVEAEYWRKAQGFRIGWSDQILGFDCGGQQWVSEICHPASLFGVAAVIAQADQTALSAPIAVSEATSLSSSSAASEAGATSKAEAATAAAAAAAAAEGKDGISRGSSRGRGTADTTPTEFPDLDYVEEVMAMIREKRIAAPAPIEQRWTRGSRSPMSPAALPPSLSGEKESSLDDVFSWVGIIMYLPSEDQAQRKAITDAFMQYKFASARRMWDRFGAHEHWAKIEIPEDDETKQWLKSRLSSRFPVERFNFWRRELDPHGILSNPLLDELIPRH